MDAQIKREFDSGYAVSKTDKTDNSVIEVEVKDVTDDVSCAPKKKASCGYTPSILVSVIEPLAKKMGDKTVHYHNTYSKVYEVIGVKKMERMTKKYTKEHGRPPRGKSLIFMDSDKNFKVFRDAVKQLESTI